MAAFGSVRIEVEQRPVSRSLFAIEKEPDRPDLRLCERPLRAEFETKSSMAPGLSLSERILKFPLFFSLAGMAMKSVSYSGRIDRAAMAEIGHIPG